MYIYICLHISKSGHDPANFLRVSIEHIHIVQELIERNIFINNFDIQEGKNIRELAQKIIGKITKQ